MAAIRHYTSRGGDPHRHLHLQINARVPAAGKWRGIDSAQLLRMQRAINGIGHRTVMADPEFRAALALHGYTVDQRRGDRASWPRRSRRCRNGPRRSPRTSPGTNGSGGPSTPVRNPAPACCGRGMNGRGPTNGKRRRTTPPADRTARPRGSVNSGRWVSTWTRTCRRRRPVTGGMPVGAVDRDEAADRVLKVLGAGGRGRSTWNVYDIRGVTEEVLAARNVIAPPQVFQELAEDVAARAEAQCLSVVDRPVPEHIRHLTSQAVIDLERDLHGRLAVRAAADHTPASVQDVAAALVRAEQAADGERVVLGEGQVAAVRAIAGTGPLVLVEGAAGAGKTTVLAVANDIITAPGQSMMVVAPSKKASMVAADQIGAEASTAARLAYQHGYRWDDDGVWTRLRPGQVDPVTGTVYTGPHSTARLTAGDTLVIDEAGMLDQETARALLRIADAADARVVYVGDRRQLPAVGRGGVLDMAAQWATTRVELGAVHRFRTPDGHPDTEYADLTLRIRSGIDPDTVFDDLNAGGHIQLWDSEADALAHLAVQTAERHLDGVSHVLAVDTNDTAAAVNEVVRDHLVTTGAVDDRHVVHGSDGLRIGVGDHVMTRRNDPDLGVANRMTWTVQRITDTGAVQLHNPDRRQDAAVDADYVRQHLHLAYASHRARRPRRHRRPRRQPAVRRHRRRRRVRRADPRPSLEHRAHRRRIGRRGPRTVGRRGRPEPRRPRPGPGPRRRDRAEARNYAAITDPQPRPAGRRGPAELRRPDAAGHRPARRRPANVDAAAAVTEECRRGSGRSGTTASTNTRTTPPRRSPGRTCRAGPTPSRQRRRHDRADHGPDQHPGPGRVEPPVDLGMGRPGPQLLRAAPARPRPPGRTHHLDRRDGPADPHGGGAERADRRPHRHPGDHRPGRHDRERSQAHQQRTADVAGGWYLAPGPVIIRVLSRAEAADDPDELDLYRQGWVLGFHYGDRTGSTYDTGHVALTDVTAWSLVTVGEAYEWLRFWGIPRSAVQEMDRVIAG